MNLCPFVLTWLLTLPLLFCGCIEPSPKEQSDDHPLVVLDTPAELFSAEPELVKSSAGDIYLSWVQRNTDTTATLQATQFLNGAWQDAFDIAHGENWFINWADFPTLAIHDSHKMAASFLSKSGAGTYAYDVKITTTENSGATWTPAFRPHLDGTESEHGFVSLLPWGADQFMAIWLDGRNTLGNHGGHGQGAMSLRSAQFDMEGHLTNSYELDDKTCDCCQTSAVRTGPESVLVAYRDRSDNEIRDIATVSYEQGIWSSPKIVHDDQWEIAGCPVNGPALDSYAGTVAIAWFTAAHDQPRVLLSMSQDKGNTFLAPIIIDSGNPMGRVAVSFLDEHVAVVSWLEKTEEAAEIQIRTIEWGSDDNLLKSQPFVISKTAASRQSGFPQMASQDKFVVFAWTEVLEADQTIVRSAYMHNKWLSALPRN